MATISSTTCSECGQTVPAVHVYIDPAQPLCLHCGSPLANPAPGASPGDVREKITRLARQHDGANERLGLLKQEQDDLLQQLHRVAAGLRVYEQQGQDSTRRIEALAAERGAQVQTVEKERHLREQAEARVEELHQQTQSNLVNAEQILFLQTENARLQAQLADVAAELETRTRQIEHNQDWIESLNRDQTSLTDERAGLAAQLNAEKRRAEDLHQSLITLRAIADAALPLESRISELETENAALRTRLHEAERSLLDAATMVEQVADLRQEIERLGSRYIQSQQELSHLLRDRNELRDQLARLAAQVQTDVSDAGKFTAVEIERARQTIRQAQTDSLRPPPE